MMVRLGQNASQMTSPAHMSAREQEDVAIMHPPDAETSRHHYAAWVTECAARRRSENSYRSEEASVISARVIVS